MFTDLFCPLVGLQMQFRFHGVRGAQYVTVHIPCGRNRIDTNAV
ncbi:Uncharacterised protein [Vibrio cholerae]|nr:Uncharacterised protein [Vibrio cholerae]CSI65553.1 Uncharacterised protein [Vibrio cholerae]